MWFLPRVNTEAVLQNRILIEGFIALRAVVLLSSNVDLLMLPKPLSARKLLWTQVTRF